jgi:pyruvate formate lyase activating enzyme
MTDTALVFNVQKFSIHDGPGIRTLVFFQGCPLRCAWCANPESQGAETAGDGTAVPAPVLPPKRYSIDELVSICLQDRPFYEESGGGVTLSGGEVLVQHEAAASLLRRLKEEHIHTAIETTGYASPSVFNDTVIFADLLLFDIKHYDSPRHSEGTGVSNDIILANLRYALERHALEKKREVLPRIPVIRGYNDAPDDARGFSRLFRTLGINKAQLLPFHQAGETKYESLQKEYTYKGVPQLHNEDLRDFRQIFIENGIECFFCVCHEYMPPYAVAFMPQLYKSAPLIHLNTSRIRGELRYR